MLSFVLMICRNLCENIGVSIITISFPVYIFALDSDCGAAEQNIHVFSCRVDAGHELYREGQFYTWKYIIGNVLDLCFILLLTWDNNMWKICTTMQHTIPLWWPMLGQWVGAHCIHSHVRYRLLYMTVMWHHIIFTCFKYITGSLKILSALCILDLVFFFNNYPVAKLKTNAYFWYRYNTQKHTQLCTEHKPS